MYSRAVWIALWLMFAGAGAHAEIKAGDRVVLGRSAALWYGIQEGIWAVEEVTEDGKLVTRDENGRDHVLKASNVSVISSSPAKQVILIRDLRRNLRAGVWRPAAMAADGSVVLQSGIWQYVVPKWQYEAVADSGPKKIVLWGTTYSVNSGLQLKEGVWPTIAIGVDGTAVVETLSGTQQVVRARDYRKVVSRTCRWKDV